MTIGFIAQDLFRHAPERHPYRQSTLDFPVDDSEGIQTPGPSSTGCPAGPSSIFTCQFPGDEAEGLVNPLVQVRQGCPCWTFVRTFSITN